MGFKKVLYFAAAAAIAFCVVGCGGKNKEFGDQSEAKDAYPKAIQDLVRQYQRDGVIHAVGEASSTNRQTAMQKARFNATQQIAAQFKQDVAAMQNRFLEEIGDQNDEVFRAVERIFVNTTLHGDRVVKEMVAQGKEGFTAYVLRVLDPSAMKQLLQQQQNAEILKKAEREWQNLEMMVEKDNARKAAEN